MRSDLAANDSIPIYSARHARHDNRDSPIDEYVRISTPILSRQQNTGPIFSNTHELTVARSALATEREEQPSIVKPSTVLSLKARPTRRSGKVFNEESRKELEERYHLDEDELEKQEMRNNLKRRCFYRVNEVNRIRWDLSIMILATWNCFSIPFNVAFEPEVSHVGI